MKVRSSVLAINDFRFIQQFFFLVSLFRFVCGCEVNESITTTTHCSTTSCQSLLSDKRTKSSSYVILMQIVLNFFWFLRLLLFNCVDNLTNALMSRLIRLFGCLDGNISEVIELIPTTVSKLNERFPTLSLGYCNIIFRSILALRPTCWRFVQVTQLSTIARSPAFLQIHRCDVQTLYLAKVLLQTVVL